MSGADTRADLDVNPGPDDEAGLDAEATADYAAGRVVPHATVVAWLES